MIEVPVPVPGPPHGAGRSLRKDDLPSLMTAVKVRLRFAKRGELRLVSHHDLMRCLERTLRRAAVPMAYSQGFNPRPKAVFAQALALGIEGRREVLELELAEPLEPADLLERLRAQAPPGFDFLEAEAVGPGRSPQVVAAEYALNVPPERLEGARDAVAAFLADERRPFVRRRPDRPAAELDLRASVLAAAVVEDGDLRFRLKMAAAERSARPEEVVETLGLRDLLEAGAVLVRIGVELASASAPPGPTPPESNHDPTHNGPRPEAADGPPTAPIGASDDRERSTE